MYNNKNVLGKPIITVFPGYANTQTLYIDKNDGYQWFLQNFFLMIYNYNEEENAICSEFMNLSEIRFAQKYNIEMQNILCLPVESYCLPRTFVEANFKMIDFVEKSIDDGYCVHLYLDRRFIRIFNEKRKYSHQTFITGYDKQKRILYFNDYFNRGIYQEAYCTYEEFIEAYNNNEFFYDLDDGICYEYEIHDKIALLKYKESFSFEFSEQKFADDISKYLGEEKFELPFIPKIHNMKNDSCIVVQNTDGQQILMQYHDRKLSDGNIIDLRQICLFIDHKIALKHKIAYLVKNNKMFSSDNIVSVENLIKKANIIKAAFIKHNVTLKSSKTTRDNIATLFVEINDMEKELLLTIRDLLG